MREVLLILGVVIVLLALTALRYRKQIAGVIGVARMLQDVRNSGISAKREREPAVHLVNCEKCGVWVPENKAQKRRDGGAYCAKCA